MISADPALPAPGRGSRACLLAFGRLAYRPCFPWARESSPQPPMTPRLGRSKGQQPQGSQANDGTRSSSRFHHVICCGAREEEGRSHCRQPAFDRPLSTLADVSTMALREVSDFASGSLWINVVCMSMSWISGRPDRCTADEPRTDMGPPYDAGLPENVAHSAPRCAAFWIHDGGSRP